MDDPNTIEDLADYLDLQLEMEEFPDPDEVTKPSPEPAPFTLSPEALRRQRELADFNNSSHRLATPRGHPKRALQQVFSAPLNNIDPNLVINP